MSHATPQPDKPAATGGGTPSGTGDSPAGEPLRTDTAKTDTAKTDTTRTDTTRTDLTRIDATGGQNTGATGSAGYDRAAVVARQKEQFGGMKFGATFFGWLTAAGAGVLLTALLASVGAGIGLSTTFTVDQVTGNAGTLGVISAIVLLLVIFVAYFCGGYVASRMTRFNGAKQGFGVWLWAIIAAVVIAVLAAVTGNQLEASRYLNGAPQIPVSPEALTASGIIAAVAVLVVALIGAVLGGLTGMRYHRRVDRAGDDI